MYLCIIDLSICLYREKVFIDKFSKGLIELMYSCIQVFRG